MPEQPVFFLPGRGENLHHGLGRVLSGLGHSILGRALIGEFVRLRFAEQLALIRSDLQTTFWKPGAKLVARSYGAYLLLHTLADMKPFPGKILLCSPVLGAAVAKNGFFGSRPPRAEKLLEMAASNAFPAPGYMEIHTGAEDDGCDPLLAKRFASLVRITKLNVVPGAGHELGEDYLQGVLREFLGDELDSASKK